jgi:hypothetical protein
MDNLMTQDWKEAVVSLRCFVEQLQLTRNAWPARPTASWSSRNSATPRA